MHRPLRDLQVFAIVSVAICVVALVRKYLIVDMMHDAPFILFLVPVALAGWLRNWKWAMTTTAVCLVVGTTMFIEHDGWSIPDPADQFIVYRFVVVGIITSWLFEQRWAAERRSLVSLDRARGAQAQLDEVNQNLRLVTDSMAALVTRCSRDLRYLWASQSYADWIGLPVEQIVGRSIVSVLGAKNLDQLMPKFERVLSGERVKFEEELEIAGEASRYVSAVYTPTFDAAGTCNGWVAVIHDITAGKRREHALIDNERRKDELLAMLGHELRNPLAAASNALSALPLAGDRPELVTSLVDTAGRQVRHLVRIIDDLLDASRITHGKIKLRRGAVDLCQVVNLAIESVRPSLNQRRHQFSSNLPPKPVWVDGDSMRLVQVLANLLSNSAKFTRPGGVISVELIEADQDATVHVRDNGQGIAPELLDEIFELFRQADHGANRSQGGLGIGLTVVKQIVEMHGGHVAAHSAGPDRGSTFSVVLPRLASQLTPDTAREIPGALEAAPRRRVLIVDDVVDSGESLAVLLEMAGHEAIVVHDGPAGVEAVLEHRPDVALIDIGMPEVDGFEVVRRIRSNPNIAGTCLVALTGYSSEATRRDVLAAGFDGFLAKPTDLGQLQSLLKDLPSRQHAGSPDRLAHGLPAT